MADGKTLKTLRFGQESHVIDVTWTDDDQITVARAKPHARARHSCPAWAN